MAERARKALDAVHQRGICHGDVSAENVLVVDSAQVCLC